jgi:hypothetical protein
MVKLEELRRFRPVIYADSADRFLEPVTMHGGESGLWLQYWIAWPGDRDHSGIDWEVAMVRIGVDARPVELVAAQHRTARRRPWGRVELEGGRPVVYAGRDKHSTRFRRGWHLNGWHLERANGAIRLDLPLELGVPPAVAARLAHRDPDEWLRRLGVL